MNKQMIYSCGIIPFRRNSSGDIEFFLGHPCCEGRDWMDYWAYLKGGAEGEESWEDAALREFHEESGVSVQSIPKNSLIPLGYVKQNKHKIAVAFGLYLPDINPEECFSNMAEGENFPEIDEYKWMTFDELKKKTHPTHVNFYQQITELIS